MTNNVVYITGATKGLGLSIAQNLDLSKFKVVILGRSLSEEAQKFLLENKDHVFFEEFDFANTLKIRDLCKNLIKSYGVPWAIVNNAAIGGDGILSTMHEKDIEKIIDINLKAPIFTKYMSRQMLINRKGRVINISSIIANTGFSGLSVYGATKSALIGFTKSLSRELGKYGITVNAVCPGYMETAMTEGLNDSKLESIINRSPMKSLASKDDVARLVSFILDETNGHITGSSFVVDAGSTA